VGESRRRALRGPYQTSIRSTQRSQYRTRSFALPLGFRPAGV